MRRTSKKKVKKKSATKPRPKRQAEEVGEFDDWAEQQKNQSGCSTCRESDVTETIRALLGSMIRKRAYKTTVHAIRQVIEQKHPDANVGQRGLERHLLTCERDLYFRARGRRNG